MAGPKWMQRQQVVRIRQRWDIADLALDVFTGYREHRSSRTAAALTYYSFLSLFPLLLVFTTIVGFVLEDNKDLQERIVDSVIAKIPLIGDQIIHDPTALTTEPWVLISGLVLALWAGMRAFVGIFSAFDDIADTPLDGRTNLPMRRLLALLTITVVGVSQVATAVLSALIGVAGFPNISRVLLLASSVLISSVVLGAAMHWLRSIRPSWRSVVPGAIVGGIGFAVLQVLGTTLVGRALVNAGAIYGTFASVIALMAWLNFHAYITLIAAELNQVLLLRSQRTTEEAQTEDAMDDADDAGDAGRRADSASDHDADTGQVT